MAKFKKLRPIFQYKKSEKPDLFKALNLQKAKKDFQWHL